MSDFWLDSLSTSILCVRTANALARLRRCVGSHEPLLVTYVINTKISWAGSNISNVQASPLWRSNKNSLFFYTKSFFLGKIKWKKRTISNAYQIPPAGQWRKLISRIQRPYKMAKLFNQKNFFLAWHFFTHMLNISILLIQSIRNFQ